MRFSFSFPLWIAAFILTAATIIIIIAYRNTDKPLGRTLKFVLIALRIGALCLVLLCLLEPTIKTQKTAERKTKLIFLMDDSQSMSLKDPGDSISRIEAVKNAFSSKDSNFLDQVAKKFSLIFYQFSNDLQSVDELNLTAQGTITDIGKALSKTSNEWRGQPASGIVLVTDGGNNAGENPLEGARLSGIPIYTVGVGDPKMPKDVQITRIDVNPIAYAGHILPIKAMIKSSGYNGQEVKIDLSSESEKGRVLDSVSIKLNSQLEQAVDLQLRPRQEGVFSFSVSMPSFSDEITQKNNSFQFFIKVVKAKLKVLYVDAGPRWEFTFLNRALLRDPNIEITSLVFKKNPKSPEGPVPKLPNTQKELFNYDILILGDINQNFFNPEQLRIVKSFVESKGGSIVFLGGKNSLGRGGFGESILRDMLPIEISPAGTRPVSGAFNPILTQEGMRHPLTRLRDDEAENTSIWRDLPALNRLYVGNDIKVGAIVLAEHQRERGQPVIAFQRYGKGMVLLIASDTLWRWAFGGYSFGNDDSYYRRFWSGAIRWFASMLTEADLVRIEADKGSYYKDEKVLLTAYIYDENYAPLDGIELKAEAQINEVETQIISGFKPDGRGKYSNEFIPNKDGKYKIMIEGVQSGKSLGKGSTEFIVQPTILEFQEPQLREDLLKNIADVSGGSYIHLKDISNLSNVIKEKSFEPYAFINERGIWDNVIVLIIAIGILAAEWLLRKRNGLV